LGVSKNSDFFVSVRRHRAENRNVFLYMRIRARVDAATMKY